jgi:hypothetical protein
MHYVKLKVYKKFSSMYYGSKNPMIYRNTLEIDLHCKFVLYNYPFDVQHCKIVVIYFYLFNNNNTISIFYYP